MLKVFCVCCKKHIYNIEEIVKCDSPISSNFKPASKKIPEPITGDRMLCPFCGNYFIETDVLGCCIILTDKGFMPK
jgi:hypothetical protein